MTTIFTPIRLQRPLKFPEAIDLFKFSDLLHIKNYNMVPTYWTILFNILVILFNQPAVSRPSNALPIHVYVSRTSFISLFSDL